MIRKAFAAFLLAAWTVGLFVACHRDATSHAVGATFPSQTSGTTYQQATCLSVDGGTCLMEFPIPPNTSGEVEIKIASLAPSDGGGFFGGNGDYACGVLTQPDAGCKLNRACAAVRAYQANDAGADANAEWTKTVTVIPDAGCVATVLVGGGKVIHNISWKANETYTGIP
jgi:hypothetical protein